MRALDPPAERESGRNRVLSVLLCHLLCAFSYFFFVQFCRTSLDIPPLSRLSARAAAHRAQRNTHSGLSPAQLDSGEPAHGDGGGGRRLGGGLRLAH